MGKVSYTFSEEAARWRGVATVRKTQCIRISDRELTLASPAMGLFGTCPSSTPNCFIFQVTPEAHSLTNSDIRLSVVAYPVKAIQTDSFVTIYCINFVIFLCVTLKLSSLSFVLLLTPNPGDTTRNGHKPHRTKAPWSEAPFQTRDFCPSRG